MAGVKGRSGRRPKSAAQHKLEGTYNSTRHEGIENPEPPKGTPQPPCELAGHEKAEWERMVKRLEESKTITVVDDAVLYQYVQQFAEVEEVKADRVRLRQMKEALMKTAMARLSGDSLVETVAKIVDLEYLMAKQSQQLRQGHLALKTFLVEFGMTPASRSRVRITQSEDEQKPKSPLAQLQQQARVLRFGGA